MIIERIALKNFRNFENLEIPNLGRILNIFSGPNGSGKSNMLEALGLAALAKSCRGSGDSEMVRIGADVALVEIEGLALKKK